VGEDGATRLEHLKAVSHKVKVPELDYEEPNEDAVYLLEYFYSVKQAKGKKISYTELNNFSSMLDLSLSPFEVDIIMMIDRIFEGSVHG